MNYKKNGNLYVIKINRGEKVIEQMLAFLEEKGINSAFFQGIGAVDHAILNYYSFATKNYVETIFNQEMEVTSINGNVSLFKGKPTIHAHINMADGENNVIGGHLKEGTVSGTVEIFLQVIDIPLERKFDEETELNLLDI